MTPYDPQNEIIEIEGDPMKPKVPKTINFESKWGPKGAKGR